MDFNVGPWDDLLRQELQCRDIVAPYICLQ